MKVNILEAHDRFQHVVKQDFDISACAEDLLKQRPFGKHPFYIFVHARATDDLSAKKLIWQPRLTRPKPQTNSMLFKGYPDTMEVRICWMIPPREMFNQYKKGNVTEHDVTQWSINMFEHKREELARNEPDDLSDADIDAIYRSISRVSKREKNVIGIGQGMIIGTSESS